MELFKFLPTPEPTSFNEGRMINGAKSIMWTERYRGPGEFEIVAPLSSDLKNFLPMGTLVSHVNTFEVMVVENQEVKEDKNGDPEIKITGRSLETYLENRIVGMNQIRSNNDITEYVMIPDYSSNQVVSLINDHIANSTFVDDNIPNVYAVNGITGVVGIVEPRSLKRDDLYKAVIEILTIDDLGIKVIRRNPFGTPNGSNMYTHFVVHKGNDRSATVIFSWKAGDIETAEYLWSDKRLKNSVVILGRYLNTVYDTVGVTKFNRRTMIISGDDIDGIYSSPPQDAARTDVLSKMQVRGRAVLNAMQSINLTRTDLANVSRYQYRKDFNVGDLVSVDSNFGQIAVMRITEYVEIMDENGVTGHPTLSLPGV